MFIPDKVANVFLFSCLRIVSELTCPLLKFPQFFDGSPLTLQCICPVGSWRRTWVSASPAAIKSLVKWFKKITIAWYSSNAYMMHTASGKWSRWESWAVWHLFWMFKWSMAFIIPLIQFWGICLTDLIPFPFHMGRIFWSLRPFFSGDLSKVLKRIIKTLISNFEKNCAFSW